MVSYDTRVIGCRTKSALCPREAVFTVAGRGEDSLDVDSELLDGDVVRLRKDSEPHGASCAATIGGERQMIGADVQMIGADERL
jgi:hypothetical protein